MDSTFTKNIALGSVVINKPSSKNKTFTERLEAGESFSDLMKERIGTFESQRQTLKSVTLIFLKKYKVLEIRLNKLDEKLVLHEGNRSIQKIIGVLKIEINDCINEIRRIKKMEDNNESNYRVKSKRLFSFMANHYHLREEIEFLEKHLDVDIYNFKRPHLTPH